MKNLRQLCAAVVLTLALVLPAFAGEMECGITPPPQPSAMAEGHMEAGVMSQSASGGTIATDPFTVLALNLLQRMLSF
jgi:hypothetical protein